MLISHQLRELNADGTYLRVEKVYSRYADGIDDCIDNEVLVPDVVESYRRDLHNEEVEEPRRRRGDTAD